MLNDEQVREFQDIYKNYFGISISKEEAYSLGTRLVLLIRTICRPIDQRDINKYGNENEKSKDRKTQAAN